MNDTWTGTPYVISATGRAAAIAVKSQSNAQLNMERALETIPPKHIVFGKISEVSASQTVVLSNGRKHFPTKEKKMSKVVDLTGKRFERLLVIERAENTKGGTRWRVVCDCGTTKIVPARGLRRGSSKSCGCLRLAQIKKRNTKHGYARGCPSPLYASSEKSVGNWRVQR
jgi:hypothetical protein